jgi:hypothetical protein
MDLRTFFYSLSISFLVFYFAVDIFGIVTFPSDPIYFVAVFILSSLLIQLHKNLLEFFAIKKAFLTVFISVAILVGVALYVFELLLPGFYISDLAIQSQEYSFISIESQTIVMPWTAVVLGVTTGLLYSIIDSLKSKS